MHAHPQALIQAYLRTLGFRVQVVGAQALRQPAGLLPAQTALVIVRAEHAAQLSYLLGVLSRQSYRAPLVVLTEAPSIALRVVAFHYGAADVVSLLVPCSELAARLAVACNRGAAARRPIPDVPLPRERP